MEGEVAAIATKLESSVGLKRKKHIRAEYAADFRDVQINGGLVEFGFCDRVKEKTKNGKGSGDGELPKTKGGEADSGSKEEGGEADIGVPKTKGGEADSGSKAKPAGGRKRKKMVKYTLGEKSKQFWQMEPISFNLARCSKSFAASHHRFLELRRNILHQYKTKGYAVIEKEVEVTDNEKDPN